MPRVVLGVERGAVVELARLWIGGKNKELATHPVQIHLLDEIAVQLESYRDYAQNTGKGDLAKVYDKQLRIVQGIAAQPAKRRLREEVEADTSRERDQTQQAIHLGAAKLKARAV